MIGRAIIAGRPYRDPEDLLSKRVLNRAAFARIREQVAAR
jgi:DNA uptake protein ComE-like DNA-binding protein